MKRLDMEVDEKVAARMDAVAKRRGVKRAVVWEEAGRLFLDAPKAAAAPKKAPPARGSGPVAREITQVCKGCGGLNGSHLRGCNAAPTAKK